MDSSSTTIQQQLQSSTGPLWPIALARRVRSQIGDAPGFTLFVFGLNGVAFGTYCSIMLRYELALWRQSWQLVWPGIDGVNLLFPFVLLVIGALLGRVLHGRIWSTVLIGLYIVLQLQATHPAVPWSQLARVVQAQPVLLLAAIWHSILPVFVLLVIVALVIELAGPALHAAIAIYHAGQRAREQTRHNAMLRELEAQAWRDQAAHQRALLELAAQQRHLELATQRQVLLQLAAARASAVEPLSPDPQHCLAHTPREAGSSADLLQDLLEQEIR